MKKNCIFYIHCRLFYVVYLTDAITTYTITISTSACDSLLNTCIFETFFSAHGQIVAGNGYFITASYV